MSFPLRSYKEYRESSYNWLGHLPSHWQDLQIRRLFRIENGATPKSSIAEYWEGKIPWVTPDDLGRNNKATIRNTRRNITEAGYQSCGATLVPAGSLIISTRAPVGYVAITEVPMCTNQGCRALVARQPLSERYYYYHLISIASILDGFSAGSTFRELPTASLAEFRIVKPPLDEQSAITAFLDYETTRMDQLIQNLVGPERVRVSASERKLERSDTLIGLLRERREAIITAVVTGKIDVRDWQPPQSIDEAEERDHALLEAAEERASYRV